MEMLVTSVFKTFLMLLPVFPPFPEMFSRGILLRGNWGLWCKELICRKLENLYCRACLRWVRHSGDNLHFGVYAFMLECVSLAIHLSGFVQIITSIFNFMDGFRMIRHNCSPLMRISVIWRFHLGRSKVKVAGLMNCPCTMNLLFLSSHLWGYQCFLSSLRFCVF